MSVKLIEASISLRFVIDTKHLWLPNFDRGVLDILPYKLAPYLLLGMW